MIRSVFTLVTIIIFSVCAAQVATPDQVYGELFTDVQTSRIFPDSKTFVDCIPKKDPKQIVTDYKALKSNPAVRFSLKLFITEHFIIPDTTISTYKSSEKDITRHITQLWQVLKRRADSEVKGSSLLPLPYPYIVPGGRFREIYYWDSYFTMLGLKESGEDQLIEQMVKNFAYLIHNYVHIPNGNRSYYLSRSQPPFFSLMLDLLAEIKGREVYVIYQPALEKEYEYWMDRTAATKHLVKMPDGSLLNRYYDQLDIPRQESYIEDVKTASAVPESKRLLVYRNLRSAAESGWDFSSRWFRDGKNISTIQTTSIIPVDLNALLYHTELTLAKSWEGSGNKLKATYYRQLANLRKKSINKYCWSAKEGWYKDFNIATRQQTPSLSLAGMFPFFLRMSDTAKLKAASKVIVSKFLKAGGLVSTTMFTGEQWDAPNGWAPLQWVSIIGLENYGQQKIALDIARRWVTLNEKVFNTTGKLMEKYNVVNTNLEAGGGEYPSQDGFGWTNGVLIALINKYAFND